MLGQSVGGRGPGAVKPAGGVQLIKERPPGLVAPPLPQSAGVLALTVPNDEMTRRCAAQLAPILGPDPINVIGLPASAAQEYVPPPVVSATAARTAVTRASTPSPTPSLDQPPLTIVTATSTGATTTQTPSATSHVPLATTPVVTLTTTTTIHLASTRTPATVAQTSASAGASTRAKSSAK